MAYRVIISGVNDKNAVLPLHTFFSATVTDVSRRKGPVGHVVGLFGGIDAMNRRGAVRNWSAMTSVRSLFITRNQEAPLN